MFKGIRIDVETGFEEQYHKGSARPQAVSEHEEDEILTYIGDFVDISKKSTLIWLALPYSAGLFWQSVKASALFAVKLNEGECGCSVDEGDIRLAPLRQLYEKQA